ncbi:hypothetical protein [Acidovorax sp.]|uniref:hypothetical protein n=1 Tax=Acidovorax sp. TaxID=1872122 RepID=UPI0025C1E672|nr:hypothetical protein [Acidovorax sp.]MBL7090812.1 hypothetical protein [Acidovorax sp.]
MSTEPHALLWSKKSNCFHIEPLQTTVDNGLRFFRSNSTNDYLVIAIGTRDECGAKADELRPVLREREEVRRLFGTE